MRAITVSDRTLGASGLTVSELPYPHMAENDVIVEVYAASFISTELEWPGTWTDRTGRERSSSVLGHELSGVVTELGYGTTGLTIGQRVFGIADWARDGSLAEYVAVEARNLAPLPTGVEHPVGAALAISGLTAWQALFDHARIESGQTLMVHGAGGSVGAAAVQLATELGAVVIGTGRARDRDLVLGLGARAFVDLDTERLEDSGPVDAVLDVIGGDIRERSMGVVRQGGTIVSIAEPIDSPPPGVRAVFFVVEPNRAQLSELARRVAQGRLLVRVGAMHSLEETPAAFTAHSGGGKTIIEVRRESTS